MTPYTPTVPKETVEKVKTEVRKIIRHLGTRAYITKGNIDHELRQRETVIAGHEQYFSRVINDGIVEARFTDHHGIKWKYIPWSNARNGGHSRSYKKVRA
jgi:uncharacterized GH25 family protein